MKRVVGSFLLFAGLVFAQPGFSVQDLNGERVAFNDFSPVTVITFISTQCPVSNAYNDRMTALYNAYAPKGVKFIFVNANRNEAASEVAEHAKSVAFPFKVYKDPNNELADRFDAQVTPESYVLDARGKLLYHGQVDDNRNQARVRQQSLKMALDSVLAGKPVAFTETKAFGCTIKRARKNS